ncbi:MAG: DNA helicase PcrA [Spirulinaceae cyanobacterium SM2_1_0]|nr:DNA helicase PcrA [Spirulinaceae cyanobacterium SM2_1_0]
MVATADALAHLNPSQRRAVEHHCGPLLVVAGAGSGKTRALTFRIFQLIHQHRVAPDNILAVTFTNKAAREMRDRIEKLFADQLAQQETGKPLTALPAAEQTQLRSRVYKQQIKPLWIGTFHSLFARILRYDIDKYQDEQGHQWQRNFSIFDESDVQGLVKEIVLKDLNLDEKKFNPRSVRYAMSNAKNLLRSPTEYLNEATTYRERTIAEVYSEYQKRLAANNGLDFDDLILIPTRLFQQNETILGYWHYQFQHILVDEYQDTNRTQYELIRLLATNGETRKEQWNWQRRSLFAVGDADQSIYSFRMADYKILLDFQRDFGDGLPDATTQTMVKLEENYRSRENILQAANHLIAHNTERIDKVLRPTRGEGERIYLYQADSERDEAQFVLGSILKLRERASDLGWGSFAILYRTNAQSRVLEDAFRGRVPYMIVGGLKFYDRKEIKDAIAYLRLLANPADTVSLLRAINTPRRGIGKATIDNLISAAQQLGVPLWEIISDETSVNTIAGRTAKAVNGFAALIKGYQGKVETSDANYLVRAILEDAGYLDDLKSKGTDEAKTRLENIYELFSAVDDFQREYEDTTLAGFLANASLASDLDNLAEGQEAISLMTLHSAKGLEFPIVFLVGLEQGLFPNVRSLDDPQSLEEERRLCYVGITRAQERLFLSQARQRNLWGSTEPAIPSQFLMELPPELIERNGRAVLPRAAGHMATAEPVTQPADDTPGLNWKVGDRVIHNAFGEGEVILLLGSGRKQNLAINFPAAGRKIIDPRVAQLERIEA